MDYVKKIAVLKEVEYGYALNGKALGGIATLETESGVTTLFLSLINFTYKSGGEYIAYFIDGNEKLTAISLGEKANSTRHVFSGKVCTDKGFSVGVYFVCGSLPILTCFCKTEDSRIEADFLTKKVAEIYYGEFKEKQKQSAEKPEPTVNTKEQENPKPITPSEYNDEAVATTNYYLLNEDISSKMDEIDKIDENFSSEIKQENAEEKTDDFSDKNESSDFSAFILNGERDEKEYSENNPYFNTVKDELESILSKFPIDEELSRFLPNGRFSKVTYSEDKYYVVGYIKENGKEKYICYGIPGEYSKEPPEELKGYCTFVPLSLFNLSGKGYWMMFQDAITGECASKNQT